MSLLSPQLHAFLNIVRYRTVHSAAEALHITQTAVTQRLKVLEQNLNTSLFIRTRRGMRLTPEGEALLRYCQAVQGLEGEALAKIQGAAIETEVQVCITGPTSIMHSRIIAQCFTVLDRFAQLLIHFDITDSEERVKALRAGRCQFAVIQPEQITQDLQSKVLKPEDYVLVCSRRWQSKRLTDIVLTERIIDYNAADQMTFNYLRHYQLPIAETYTRHFVNRTESLAAMIAAGYGYGVLTTEFSKPYIDSGQLIVLNQGKTYQNTLMLAWYERREPPAYFMALRDAIT